MRKIFLFIGTMFLACSIQAQDIFKQHGFNKEILTLSKGRYEEVFTSKEIVRVGSVLLNTKANTIVEFLEEETEDLSFKAEHSSRWLTPDPLAEKHPEMSPYCAMANNPIRYIDPDGRDIRIYYEDENGKTQVWIFNGSNQEQAPVNQFVGEFIAAYNYNIENGGGDMLKTAAETTDYTLNLVQVETGSNFQTTFRGASTEGTVFWNPYAGIQSDKGTLSPATVLEHEMDHGVQWQTKTAEHNRDQKIDDSHFTNKEEKRVITGSEYKTAVANGEIKPIPASQANNPSSYRPHKTGYPNVVYKSSISVTNRVRIYRTVRK